MRTPCSRKKLGIPEPLYPDVYRVVREFAIAERAAIRSERVVERAELARSRIPKIAAKG